MTDNKQHILPSGMELSPRTAASAQRGLARLAEAKETEKLKKLLLRLSPSIAAEFRNVLEMSAAKGLANSGGWAPESTFNAARGALDTQFALAASGIACTSMLDFGSNDAVDAIVVHYTTASGSQRNAARILKCVRMLVRRLGGKSTEYLGRAIKKAEKTPRRGEDEVLPTAEACLAGAMAEFVAALEMLQSGKPRRGRTRLRDSVILAVEVATNFRRGEFAAITLDVVFFDDARAEVRFILPESASKVREVQLGIVKDAETIKMLRTLVADRTDGHLFRTNWASPLASASGYKALKRTGERATGIQLNFNKARRIGVSAETSLRAMRARKRHAANSEVAELVYSWHPDDVGNDVCRNALKGHGLSPKKSS